MIESQLPQGKTVQTAGKAEFLAAVCAAVKKYRSAAPQIVRFAVDAHPEWKKDILRTAYRCLGTDDCRLLNRVLQSGHLGLSERCPGADRAGSGTRPGLRRWLRRRRQSGRRQLWQPSGQFESSSGLDRRWRWPRERDCGLLQRQSPASSRLREPQEFLNANPGATLGECQVTQAQNN